MLTEKDYCDYDTCAALEGLGLTILDRCVPDYLEGKRIHIWDAWKWLREEKQIEIVVLSSDYVGEPYFADIHMYREVRCACSYADSYEEALSEGIKEAIKLLKEERK